MGKPDALDTEPGGFPTHDPGPSGTLLWSMTVVWTLAAAILFWLGFILDASDVGATDGVHRILFTLVPIQAFSWIMSVVFLGIGALTARGAIRANANRPDHSLKSDRAEHIDGARPGD